MRSRTCSSSWLDRIEREISDLQRQAYSGGSSGAPVVMDSGAGAANLQARIVELEEQVRDLTGRLEEANHRAVRNCARVGVLREGSPGGGERNADKSNGGSAHE